ncbi:MAG TPA: hypothetical protein PKD15_00240 [Candidatus Saccharibacteria bacterium]|nr:hypothetical protein [Candidatus Saccharibacteria bacterium]
METAVLEREVDVSKERYAQSLTSIRQLGYLAMEGYELVPPDAEIAGVSERVWNDFITAVEENIATDPEYGEKLVFNKLVPREIVDGHVVDEKGNRAVDMVRNGARLSELLSKDDEEMKVQAYRDQGDVLIAERVDELKVGELLWAVSMDPKKAIRSNRAYWEDKMHYREGMAVIQVYFRSSSDKMMTGAYAVKKSDIKAMTQIYNEHGRTIVEPLEDADWIRNFFVKEADLQEAKTIAHKVRARHNELIGNHEKEYSVTDFLSRHHHTVQEYFDTYTPKLALAIASGRNNELMKDLASNLSYVTSLNQQTLQRLQKVASNHEFSHDDGRLMEEMIRYALVEELRKSLPAYLSEQTRSLSETPQLNESISPYQVVLAGVYARQQMQGDMIHRRLAQNIERGMQAGRTYGGCSGAGAGKQLRDGREEDIFLGGLQDVFGGHLSKNNQEESGEQDEFGPLVFECSEGHRNERKKGELLTECQNKHCKKGSVGCGEPMPVTEKVKKQSKPATMNLSKKDKKYGPVTRAVAA